MTKDKLAVFYGKAIDDKDNGIYIENIYFGGIADDQEKADDLAKQCNVQAKNAIAIIKIIPYRTPLQSVFSHARNVFHNLERDMIETEDAIKYKK